MPHRLSAAVLVLGMSCAPRPTPPPEPVRSSIAIPSSRTLGTFTVAPDGTSLAYTAEGEDGRRQLFLRSIGGSADRAVPGTEGARDPFFSPDGAWVGYFSRDSIWKAPIAGSGTAQKICDAPDDSAGATWTPDGRIVFAPLGGEGLHVVPASGGSAAALTRLDAGDRELEHGWPHALPNGWFVFTVTQRGRDSHLEIASSDGSRLRRLVPAMGHAQYVSTGHLIYSYLGNLYALAFDGTVADRESPGPRAAPVAIVKNIHSIPGYGNLGRAGFSVSRGGTLAWLPAGPDDARNRLVRVERDGRRSVMPAPAEIYQSPRLSPDGRRLAVAVQGSAMTRDIRVLEAAHSDRVMFSLVGGDNQSPAWMSDARLTFGSNRDGLQKIHVVSVSRPRDARPLFTADVSAARNPASWSRRPSSLALYEIDPSRRRDVLLYRVGESITPVAATVANERSPVLSPDGRWIAYVSDETGRDELYAMRLADAAAAAVQLTRGGGVEPAWTSEGLFYRAGEKLMLIEVKAGKLGEPRLVLEGEFERDPGANLANYDVDPRGRFFVLLKRAVAPRELRVVTNWGTELLQQAPPK